MVCLYSTPVPIPYQFETFLYHPRRYRCFILSKFDIDSCTDGRDPLNQKSADKQTDGEIAAFTFICNHIVDSKRVKFSLGVVLRIIQYMTKSAKTGLIHIFCILRSANWKY